MDGVDVGKKVVEVGDVVRRDNRNYTFLRVCCIDCQVVKSEKSGDRLEDEQTWSSFVVTNHIIQQD